MALFSGPRYLQMPSTSPCLPGSRTVKHSGTLLRLGYGCHCILSAKHNISSGVLNLALSGVEMKIRQGINGGESAVNHLTRAGGSR